VRLALGLLAILVAAGCSTHSDPGSTAASRHQPATHSGGGGCLADWNSSVNRSAREETMPPLGPYPLYGGRPHSSPKGGYQVFVGRSIAFGGEGSSPLPVCYVYFRFPHGDHGGPALVSYPEIHRAAGVYGAPSITTGRNTDVGGRIYRQEDVAVLIEQRTLASNGDPRVTPPPTAGRPSGTFR